MIPDKLKRDEFRFILIKYKEKVPFEFGWQKDSNYNYDDPKLLNHTGNVGCVTGFGNLVVIDFDSKEVQDKVAPLLPTTFTTMSGGGLLHKWFIVDNPESFKILDKEKNTLVDVQGLGKQIIIPPSKHPNGNHYKIVEDIEINKISMGEIKALFSDYINIKEEKKEQKEYPKDDIIQQIKSQLKVKDMLSHYGVPTNKNPTECPFHSSKGGKCLSYNDEVWHCFHCEKAGDIFTLFMEKEGVDFIAAKNSLAIQCGIEIKDNTKEQKLKLELQEDIPIKNVSEIYEEDIPIPKWRVENLIPEAGLTYIASEPGVGKSMFMTYVAQCIASGRSIFGLKVMQGSVCYFDAENGEVCAYNRIKMIAKGNNFKKEELECFNYSIFPNIRFDPISPFYNKFIKFYELYKPDVLIFDSLVRFMDGSENDAEAAKKVFDTMRELFKKYPNLTIIILHHLSKQHDNSMNALRGSSEIAAAASSIVMLKNMKPTLRLQVTKSRYIDINENNSWFYNLSSDEEGIYFNKAESVKDESNKIITCTNDFWNWVKDKNIKEFISSNALKHLKSLSHTEYSYYEMRKCLEKDEEIVTLTRGKYKINNLHFTAEVEDIESK